MTGGALPGRRAEALVSRFTLQMVLAAMAGAVAVAGFAPFGVWPLALLSLALLFALWQRAASTWRVFALGFAWGLGLFVAGVSWIYVSLHVYGNMPAPMAALATFLFCAYLALHPAAAGALSRRFSRALGISDTFALLAVMPAAFVALEYFRGWFLTGFPWLSLGYTQTPGGPLAAPLAGYAPLFGAFGISWLLALSAALLTLVVKGATHLVFARRARVAGVVALALLWTAGAWLQQRAWSEPAGKPLKVALLQGNVEQHLKWREDQREATLLNYAQLLGQTDAPLVVMPETALPDFLDRVPTAYLDAIKRRGVDANMDVLVGVPIAARSASPVEPFVYANSVISVGASPTQRYDKQHLVAFGEFMPPLFSWVYRWLEIPLAGFTPGADTQPALRVAGHKVAVNICYEDAFGREIARPVNDADLLVNVSNMAWYGRSLAADQHVQFSQMRAMETARWMLRATNTGVTAAIDEKGRIVHALPQFTRGVLHAEAQPRVGVTPYTRWRDLPVLLWLAVLPALAALIGRLRRS